MEYVGKESTHSPGTLRAIPSGVLNPLAKLTSRKISVHSKGVDKVYPDHVNVLRKAGLSPSNFLTMGDLRSKQDEKVDMKKEQDVNKKKNINIYFFCVYSHFFLRLSTG